MDEVVSAIADIKGLRLVVKSRGLVQRWLLAEANSCDF